MKKLLASLLVVTLCALAPTNLFATAGTTHHNAVATATAGAATLNGLSGTITTEALVTAAAGVYTLTLTDSFVTTASIANVEIDNGTNTQGIPVKGIVTPLAGSLVIKVWNLHASQAFNGTLKIRFVLEP